MQEEVKNWNWDVAVRTCNPARYVSSLFTKKRRSLVEAERAERYIQPAAVKELLTGDMTNLSCGCCEWVKRETKPSMHD